MRSRSIQKGDALTRLRTPPQIRAGLPSFIPDLVSAFDMVSRPGHLLSRGAALDPVAFSFRIAWEQWFVFRGEEAHEHFFRLKPDDVDPFFFRKRMPTLRLPGVGPPADMVRSTRWTRLNLIEIFRERGMPKLVDAFLYEARAVIAQTFQQPEGRVPDFFDFCLRACIRGSSRALFGDALVEAMPKEYTDWYVDIERDLTISRLLVPWWPSFLAPPSQGAVALVDALRTIIVQRRQMPLDRAPRDLLQRYLERRVLDGVEYELTDDEIIWTLNSVEWAAHHYPAVHAFWGVVDLLSSPEILRAVLDEQSGFDVVDGESVSKMRILRGCVFESLRRHPLVVLPRLVKRDLTFCGTALPRGSILAVSPYLSHHNEAHYPDPHRFNPMRWTTADTHPSPLRFIPGGGGQWGCIGMQLTTSMLTGFWATLLRQFHLEFADGAPTLNLTAMLMPPEGQTPLTYRRRA